MRAAARALGVSHSAVSRHLGELETWMGVPLTRSGAGRRGLVLTPEGEALGRATTAGLREIEAADIRERRTGIFYKPYLQPSIDAGLRFMREGTAGGGAATLSAEQRARVRAEFAPLLRQLGYSA